MTTQHSTTKQVYVMVLDYFYDDYKRPEGSSEIMGVKKGYHDAYKTVFKLEYEKNIEYQGEDEGDYTEDDEADKLAETIAKLGRSPPMKKKNKYQILYESLDTITEITDEFLSEWRQARENFLGASEFGIMSSGYRAKVEVCIFE